MSQAVEQFEAEFHRRLMEQVARDPIVALERKLRDLRARRAKETAQYAAHVKELEGAMRDLKAQNATMKARHTSSVRFAQATRAARVASDRDGRWLDDLTDARATIRRLKSDLEALQAEHNALQASYCKSIDALAEVGELLLDLLSELGTNGGVQAPRP